MSSRAVVKFSYDPRLEDELKLTRGETIAVIDKSSDGWWKGEVCSFLFSVSSFSSTYLSAYTNSDYNLKLNCLHFIISAVLGSILTSLAHGPIHEQLFCSIISNVLFTITPIVENKFLNSFFVESCFELFISTQPSCSGLKFYLFFEVTRFLFLLRIL